MLKLTHVLDIGAVPYTVKTGNIWCDMISDRSFYDIKSTLLEGKRNGYGLTTGMQLQHDCTAQCNPMKLDSFINTLDFTSTQSLAQDGGAALLIPKS